MVTTRARTGIADPSARTRASAAISSSTASKKRKFNTTNCGESFELPTSYVELKKPRTRHVVSSRASKFAAAEEDSESVSVREAAAAAATNDHVSTSDHVETSCCSSNGSSELVQDGDIDFVDLKAESDRIESSPTNKSSWEERGEMMTANTSELQVEPESNNEVESRVRSKEAESKRISPPTVQPKKLTVADLELEEFFAAAEKDIHKKFLDKYNYDIVKDEPVEGRFEWVRLKP